MTLGVELNRFAFSFSDNRETPEQAASRTPDDKGLKIFVNNMTGEAHVGHKLVENPIVRGYKKPVAGGDDYVSDTQKALSGRFAADTPLTVFTVSKQELLAAGDVRYVPTDLNKNARKIVAQRMENTPTIG